MPQYSPEFLRILNNLGGYKFLVYTGARILMIYDNKAIFSLPRNMSRANQFILYIKDNKKYDIQFVNTNDHSVVKFKDLYSDQVQETFTKFTGIKLK